MKYGKHIATSIREFLNENYTKSEIDDVMYGDNFNIFKNKIQSYHARIERGLIVSFYINEYLKYYDVEDLKTISSWEDFVKMVNVAWVGKKTNNKQEIVFRRGKNNDNEKFFSNNINVACVYSGPLNAYLLNLKTPYIIDCKESDWMNIDEPKIMKGVSYDGKVSTDNIVEFIKKTKKYDGIIFKNLYEGSGAEAFGPSTVYVSLDNDVVVNLTNNL